MDSGIKRLVWVAHRRSGKEKTCINIISKYLVQNKGLGLYLFPTRVQGKKIIWDGMDKEGFPFMGHFPQEIIARKNESELQIQLNNGSIFQVGGTDDFNAWMGTNPIIVIFSEYSLQDPRAWDYFRPILMENGGIAIFNFTPRGKNHGYKIYQMAKDDPNWFAETLTVNETKVISESDIEKEIREGMSEELARQEFFCSFEGISVGAYYSKQLALADSEGRITRVPYEPDIPVETWWDLGIGDSTAIWFTQTIGREIRVIDYLEASGEGFPYYAKVLQALPYVYDKHHAPHDIAVRELGSGRSRKEAAHNLGIDFITVPNLSIEDGIEAARSLLSRCWFDKVKCERGLTALQSYHKAYDDKARDWKSYPAHDWSSHGSDAFRYLAVSHKTAKVKAETPIEIITYNAGDQGLAWMG